MRPVLILTAVMAMSLAVIPATEAAEQEAFIKKKLKSAYRAGDLAKAEAAGLQAIKLRPSDGEARYYLANTLVKMGRTDDAIVQYRICRNPGNSKAIRYYANQALISLLGDREKTLMAVENATSKAANEREVAKYAQRLAAEEKAEEARLRAQYDQERENIFRSMRGRGYGRGRDFNAALNNLQEDLERRLEDLREHTRDLLTQTNCGLGNIRVVPSLSSSKVKNYINYSEQAQAASIPVENPLQASAGSLKSAPKTAPKTASTIGRRQPAKNQTTSGKTEKS